MDPRSLPSPGEPRFIHELSVKQSEGINHLDGKSVKVTGKLIKHDVSLCTVNIQDPKTGKCLVVDTKLIEPFNTNLNSIYQFIGELDTETENFSIILKARVARCVDGIDIHLYQKALEMQRKYFSSRT